MYIYINIYIHIHMYIDTYTYTYIKFVITLNSNLQTCKNGRHCIGRTTPYRARVQAVFYFGHWR